MRRLIIDTDPGIDDAIAIALAVASDEVEVLALTTVAGNIGIEKTTRNALNLLALYGREDIPVAVGAHRPFSRPARAGDAHGNDGLGGYASTIPAAKATVDPRDAVTLMVDVLTAAEEPITIVAIGPLTNVALLLAAHPGVKSKIDRLVVMGGGIEGGNMTPSAEFNIWIDPEAARRVLVEEDVPVTLVPLDVTMKCSVGDEWLGRLAAANSVGRDLVAMTPHYRAVYKELSGSDNLVMHDAIAVAEAISPGIVHTVPMILEVDCSDGPGNGATIADRRGEVPAPGVRLVDVAMGADFEKLKAFVLDRLIAHF
ncbi:MAG: nucleoside hydrolase [Kibdelosporangium sp.]